MIGAGRTSRRSLFALVASLAMVIAAAGLAIIAIPQRAIELSDSAAVPLESSDGSIARTILKELADRDLVYLDTASVAINVPPRDIYLQLQVLKGASKIPEPLQNSLAYWERVLANESQGETKRVLSALHGRNSTDVGATVLRGLEGWNALHAVVAVRDDSGDVEREGPTWVASLRLPGNANAERPTATGGNIDIQTYGFFGLGEAPSGPWHSVRTQSASSDGNPTVVVFRRELPAGEATVVDVLGFSSGLSPEIRDADGNPLGVVTRLCDDPTSYSSENGRVSGDCTAGSAGANRIAIAPANQDRLLVAEVSPVPERPAPLFDALTAANGQPLPLSWATCGAEAEDWQRYIEACADAGWRVYGDGRPIVVLCRVSSESRAKPECAIDWVEAQSTPRVDRPLTLEIRSGKKSLLTLGPDRPTLSQPDRVVAQQLQELKRLGLHPLFGGGVSDTQGLIGALWQRYGSQPADDPEDPQPVFETVELSIDTTIQDLLVNTFERDGLAQNGDVVAFTILDASGRCWSKERIGCTSRSSRGAILASYAGKLQTGTGTTRQSSIDVDFSRGVWNYLAAAAWRERVGYTANPLVSFGWTSAGSRFTPGSTFKSITALAAIEHAVRYDVDRMRDSILSVPSLDRALRMGPVPNGVIIADSWIELPNEEFGGGATPRCGTSTRDRNRVAAEGRSRVCNTTTAPAALASPSITKCGSGTSPAFGLCEAMRTSVNNYFIALAMTMEGQRPSHVTGGTGDPAAVAMARRLVPDFYDLLPGRDLGNRWSRFNGNGFAGVSSAEDHGRDVPLLSSTAQNAFGQSLQTNTATIAAAYAGIATGCRTTPWLEAGAASCKPIFEGSASEIRQALEIMEQSLIPGLYAVSNAGGTLRDYIGQEPVWRSRVFAKTGTATYPSGNRRTAWVAGWIEPEDGGDKGRYAFACMVTNTSGNGPRTCGPIVRRVLRDLMDQKK